MPQLSLYLDRDTMELMQKGAELEQLSMSRFVAGLIHERVAHRWPAGYWGLYGSLADESMQRPEQGDASLDAPRSIL